MSETPRQKVHGDMPEPQGAPEELLRKANEQLVRTGLAAEEAVRRERALREEVQAQNERLRVANEDLVAARRAEDESERRYRSLFEQLAEGFALHEIILDEHGRPCDYRFLDVNPAFERLTGLSREVVGRTVRDVLPGVEQYWIDTYGEVALTGQLVKFENYSQPLGKHFEVIAFSPARGQFATLFFDITERKRAEEALRESEERFRTMVTASSEVLYRMSPDWSEMRQLNSRDFLANTEKPSRTWLQEYIHPDDQSHVTAAINKAIETKSVFELEHRVRRADGSLGWTLSRAIPLMDADGEIVEWFGAASDITARKRAEEERERLLASEREARRRAEEAVRAREEFLSSAAHELKTPITSLRGFAQILIGRYERLGTIEPERLIRALQVIDRQSNKLAQLVTRLLYVSQLEDRRLVLHCRPVDLVPLAEEVAARARAHVRRHTLVVEAPERASAFVDPLRIEQVITNLLDNAIRFSPSGGPIEIKVTARGGEVEIGVRDHGPGIPPEDYPHLFERCHRTRPSETGEGMGIGLFISNELVKLHGGRIEVERPPDGGTRFVVILPQEQQ